MNPRRATAACSSAGPQTVVQLLCLRSSPVGKACPAERLDLPSICIAITATFDAHFHSARQVVVILAVAPLMAGCSHQVARKPRVHRWSAKGRWQGGSASMLVHVSEQSMCQERAREATMA